MAEKPGGFADDGDQQNLSNHQNPTLETITPLRNFVNGAQSRLTRATAREEVIEVPEIPDVNYIVEKCRR